MFPSKRFNFVVPGIGTRPMETPLTPLEFARRARKLYPERVAVIDGDSRWDLCAVSRSVRSLVSGLAGVWERLGRSRRLSRAQYSCAVGVVLLRAATRRCAGASELSPDRRRLSLPDQSQRRPCGLRASRVSRNNQQDSFPPALR